MGLDTLQQILAQPAENRIYYCPLCYAAWVQLFGTGVTCPRCQRPAAWLSEQEARQLWRSAAGDPALLEVEAEIAEALALMHLEPAQAEALQLVARLIRACRMDAAGLLWRAGQHQLPEHGGDDR